MNAPAARPEQPRARAAAFLEHTPLGMVYLTSTAQQQTNPDPAQERTMKTRRKHGTAQHLRCLAIAAVVPIAAAFAEQPQTLQAPIIQNTQPAAHADHPSASLWNIGPDGTADYTNQRIVLVHPTTLRQLRALHTIADVWTHTPIPNEPVVLRIHDDGITALEALGLTPQIIVDDVAKLVREEREAIDAAAVQAETLRTDDPFYDTYRPLAQIEARLDAVAAEYPSIATLFVAGNSLQNRPIRGIRLRGTGGQSGPRPSILWNGCLHAREWISPMVVLSLLETHAKNYGVDPLITNALDNIDLVVVPMVNPDGYVHTWDVQRFWRKNRRQNSQFSFGVDLNRNFAFAWGGSGSSANTGSDTYRGTAPFSEPEAAVMRDLINAEHDLIAHIDFHSYGQLILWPYGGMQPVMTEPQHTQHRELARTMAREILQSGGNVYDPRHAPGLYIASGIMSDWTYSRGGTISYTIELRPTGGQGTQGFDPPPAQIKPTASEMFIAMREFVGFLAEPVRITPTDPPPVVVDRLGSTDIDILIEPGLNRVPIDRVELVVRPTGDPSQQRTQTATHISGNTWRVNFGEFPFRLCGNTIEYAIQAIDENERVSRWPSKPDGSTIWQTSTVRNILPVRFDDFESSPAGWTAAAETNDPYEGLWQHGTPEPTPAQLGFDRTTGQGGSAWITGLLAGSNIGEYDVDGGPLVLSSPPVAWTPPQTLDDAAPHIEFWYFVSNDQGASPYMDRMFVQVSANAGPRRNVTIPEQNIHRWARVQISPTAPGEFPADQLQLHFSITDDLPGSIVEAGIDDVLFAFTGCPSCAADITGNGVTINDYFDFLTAFFSGSPLADIDNTPGVTIEDYFNFLTAFFACIN